jgi:hypothetical protein
MIALAAAAGGFESCIENLRSVWIAGGQYVSDMLGLHEAEKQEEVLHVLPSFPAGLDHVPRTLRLRG